VDWGKTGIITSDSDLGVFMSDLIEYCEKGSDHDTDPLQYKMKYINHTLDIGFFSRNRKINKDSSFSVLG